MPRQRATSNLHTSITVSQGTPSGKVLDPVAMLEFAHVQYPRSVVQVYDELVVSVSRREPVTYNPVWLNSQISGDGRAAKSGGHNLRALMY